MEIKCYLLTYFQVYCVNILTNISSTEVLYLELVTAETVHGTMFSPSRLNKLKSIMNSSQAYGDMFETEHMSILRCRLVFLDKRNFYTRKMLWIWWNTNLIAKFKMGTSHLWGGNTDVPRYFNSLWVLIRSFLNRNKMSSGPMHFAPRIAATSAAWLTIAHCCCWTTVSMRLADSSKGVRASPKPYIILWISATK